MNASNRKTVIRYRNFRFKYHIPLSDLAAVAGLSPQRLSQLELTGVPSVRSQQILLHAMEIVLTKRHAHAHEGLAAFEKEKAHLFELEQELRGVSNEQ